MVNRVFGVAFQLLAGVGGTHRNAENWRAKDTVDQGANRLAISTPAGLEVVSYEHAQLIGPHTYRLSSITRERKSTQRQTLTIGQAITHLAPGSLARVDMLNTQRGAPALSRVASFGQVVDDEPVLGFEEFT